MRNRTRKAIPTVDNITLHKFWFQQTNNKSKFYKLKYSNKMRLIYSGKKKNLI